jgi:antitoxin VapB
MGVSIKSEEAERKLRRVSRLLGKSMTATVIDLADGRLKEIDAKRDRERIHRSVERIVRRVKALPVLREGTDDELLGYNEHGLFD